MKTLKTKIKKINSIILCMIMVVGMIPNTCLKTYAAGENILIRGSSIYANGTPLLVTGDKTKTTIYIDENKNGVVDNGELSLKEAGVPNAPDNYSSLTSRNIFGGSREKDFTGDSQVIMTGGSVASIYGGNSIGANTESATFTGNSYIKVTGGTVSDYIVGGNYALGGNVKPFNGNTTVIFASTNADRKPTIYSGNRPNNNFFGTDTLFTMMKPRSFSESDFRNGIAKIDDTNYIAKGSATAPADFAVTIAAGETMTVRAGSNITIEGSFVNNGTLIIESGATLTIKGANNKNTGVVQNSGTLNCIGHAYDYGCDKDCAFCGNTRTELNHDWVDSTCINCKIVCDHPGQTGLCGVCGTILHMHNWDYSLAGDAITAICTAEHCTADNADGGSLTFIDTATYNGNINEMQINNQLTNGANVTVTYTGDNLEDGKPKHVGEYTAKVTVDGNEFDIPYVIKAKDVKVTVDNATKTFGTADPEFTYSVDGIIATEILQDIILNRTAGEDVGNYTITASHKSGTNVNTNYNITFVNGELTITKATPTTADFVFAPPENLIYDGNEKLAVFTTEKSGIGALTAKYYDKNGNETSPVNVGTYTVKLSVAENANYSGVELTKADWTFTVEKAAPVYTAPTAKTDLVYTGSEQILVTAGSSEHGTFIYDVYKIIEDNFGIPFPSWSEELPVATEAGTYIVEYYIESDENHKDLEQKSLEVTISKGTPSYIAPTGLTATYGDTLEKVVLPEGWAWKDEVTTSVGNAGENKFTAVFTPDDTANYNVVEEDLTITVEKAAPVYTVPTTLTATYGDTLADITLTNGWSWKETSSSVGNVGTNTFKAIFTPDDTANYHVVEEDLSITVKKAVPVYTAPTAKIGLVYNGAAQILITEGITEHGIFEYHVYEDNGWLNMSPQWSENLPTATDAKRYIVEYRIIGDENHLDDEGGWIKVSVDRATPIISNVTATIPANNTDVADITFTGASVDGEYTVVTPSTLIWGENTVEYTFTPADTNNYTVANGIVSVQVTDTMVPTGTVTVEGTQWNEFINSITFGLLFNKTVDVEVTAEDNLSGVKSVEYIESSTVLTLDEVKQVDDWVLMSTDEKISVSAVDAKQFVYYIRITDNADNVTYLSTDGTVFDTQKPAITGVKDGDVLYVTTTFDAADTNFEQVTVNGAPVTEFVLAGNTDITYTIIATDKAGNSTTVTVTMKPLAEITADIDALTEETVSADDTDKMEAVKDALAAVDTTNATSEEKAVIKAAQDKIKELEIVIEETEKEVAEIEKEFTDIDTSKLTSEDKESVEEFIEAVKEAQKDENLTQTQKDRLTNVIEDAEEVLKEIEANSKALEDALAQESETTSENYTVEDKADLEKVVENLENIVDTTNKNYSDQEKEAAQNEIDRINSMIEDIEEIEDTIEKVKNAADKQANVQVIPDNKEAVEAAVAVKQAYDQLDSRQKELLGEETAQQIKEMYNKAVAFEIIKGAGSSWTKGDNNGLEFVANGNFKLFTNVKVDGAIIGAENYAAVAGSTVVTLNAEYMQSLNDGKHTLTVVYDVLGEEHTAECEFIVKAKSLPVTPPTNDAINTGDNTNTFGWMAMMLSSMVVLAVVFKKKKEYENR